MPYHILIRDAYYKGEQTIQDYRLAIDGIEPTMAWKEIPGWRNKVFDYFTFLKGKSFRGQIPDFVKLYITEGDENLPQASLLGGPLSWLIFSEKLLDSVKLMMEKDVQIFDAPVYFKSGEKVKGYKIINTIRTIDCIDWEKSDVVKEKDGSVTVSYTGKIYIKENKVGDHHIFLVKNAGSVPFVSDQLAQGIAKGGFKGIAFKRCGVS